MNSERITKAMRSANYEALRSVGAAPGCGNRGRTIPSKRDKNRNPRRQRKNWRGW